jgi:hypothetical protein
VTSRCAALLMVSWLGLSSSSDNRGPRGRADVRRSVEHPLPAQLMNDNQKCGLTTIRTAG